MKLLLKRKIRIVFILLLIALVFSCSKNKMPINPYHKFIAHNNLINYRYLFLIHLNGHSCPSCLRILSVLPEFVKSIKNSNRNFYIGIIGDKSDQSFNDICQIYGLEYPVIDESDCNDLKNELISYHPTCVLIDTRIHRCVYQDMLPEKQFHFNALLAFIEAYCSNNG